MDNSENNPREPAPIQGMPGAPKKEAVANSALAEFAKLDQHLAAWEQATSTKEKNAAVIGWMREIDRVKKSGRGVNAAVDHTKQRLGGRSAEFMRAVSAQAERKRGRQR